MTVSGGSRAPMVHAPVRIVDTAIVTVDQLDAMLALIADEMVPMMAGAGVTLESTLMTSPEIGEDVTIQTTWLVPDHAAWNINRKNFFLDPRWHAAWAKAPQLRIGSDRRFFYPVPERRAAR